MTEEQKDLLLNAMADGLMAFKSDMRERAYCIEVAFEKIGGDQLDVVVALKANIERRRAERAAEERARILAES